MRGLLYSPLSGKALQKRPWKKAMQKEAMEMALNDKEDLALLRETSSITSTKVLSKQGVGRLSELGMFGNQTKCLEPGGGHGLWDF